MALDGDVASTIELLLNLIGNMDDTDVSDAHVFNFRFLFRLARPPFLMLLPSIGWYASRPWSWSLSVDEEKCSSVKMVQLVCGQGSLASPVLQVPYVLVNLS
uniref:Uncharacterized protein n=1 Tax=Oryza sativa subsp. japonica TaxID=39947 RepID=Q8H8I4_ORYSJ|nr:hypothetical protein [Oryza sativa Japonica Group]